MKLYKRTTKQKKYPRRDLIVRILYHKFMIASQTTHLLQGQKRPKAEQNPKLYAAKNIVVCPFNSHLEKELGETNTAFYNMELAIWYF